MAEVLLAIDTSTRASSVALVDLEGRVEAQAANEPASATPLVVLVERLTAGAWDRVVAYAIGIGPGSFTGLRVGLAFVKGLAAARPRPAIPVSSLAAWAATLDGLCRPEHDRWVMLDARRDQAWVGVYGVDGEGRVRARWPDARLARSELERRLESARPACATGPLADLVRGRAGWTVASDVPGPSAAQLGRLAARDLERGSAVSIRTVAPNYLMMSAAEERAGQR